MVGHVRLEPGFRKTNNVIPSIVEKGLKFVKMSKQRLTVDIPGGNVPMGTKLKYPILMGMYPRDMGIFPRNMGISPRGYMFPREYTHVP